MVTIQNQNITQQKKSAVISTAFENISPTQLYEQLSAQAFVITSNQRLSRFRLEAFEAKQLQQGKTAWHTPNILSWSAWLQQQWSTFGNKPWLNQQQEKLLWRNCIIQDENIEVFNPKALSKQAMEAWEILADFNIDTSCLDHGGEESAALLRWGESISQHTSYILQHQVLPLLTAAPCSHKQSTLILDGFDTFTPAQQLYFKQLQMLGNQIYLVSPDVSPANIHLFAYQDDDHEVRQVCQRIRQHLKQNPHHNIGVLVPDLERRAKTINRIFGEELAPQLSLQTNTELQGDYFNISLGSNLAKQPMIQSVFAILALTIKPQLKSQDITQLLLSPYIMGYDEEMNQRSALDAELKKHNQGQLSLIQLLQAIDKTEIALPLFQDFLTLIKDFTTQQAAAKHKQPMSFWISYAGDLLTQLQWQQRAAEDNTHESAQIQNWHDFMSQLTNLDDFYGDMPWRDAISHIQEHAHEQLFRPAPGHAAVQIMGILEAANLRFDYAFILGMDDITWPQSAKPNPLIPFDIQVLHQTPHANSEREWQYAQAVWHNTQYVSPTIEVSYAKSKDKQEVRPSSLLQDIGKIDDIENQASSRYAISLQQQPSTLETIKDKKLAVSADENIKGGTGILKSQSACAFQAFAHYRLKLRGLDTTTLGLNAAEQGILLHAALENFWLDVKSHQALLILLENEGLETIIQNCVAQAWTHLHRLVPVEIRHLESLRLQQLINQWLLFESKRAPFQVIASEVWRNIQLGTQKQLKLHTKLDRIDTDAQGHHIILDYKTGKTTASKTLGERPDEPQIPAYYIAENQQHKQVDALAFAQVRSDEATFQGFAQEDGILPTVSSPKGRRNEPENWQALTQQWQESLDRLADEFTAGDAEVSPKSTQSCNYCPFTGLCRIATLNS